MEDRSSQRSLFEAVSTISYSIPVFNERMPLLKGHRGNLTFEERRSFNVFSAVWEGDKYGLREAVIFRLNPGYVRYSK